VILNEAFIVPTLQYRKQVVICIRGYFKIHTTYKYCTQNIGVLSRMLHLFS